MNDRDFDRLQERYDSRCEDMSDVVKQELINLPRVDSNWYDCYAGEAPHYLALCWKYRANIRAVIDHIIASDNCLVGNYDNFLSFIDGSYFDCLKCINEAYDAINRAGDYYRVREIDHPIDLIK